jgi:hypothetical protein
VNLGLDAYVCARGHEDQTVIGLPDSKADSSAQFWAQRQPQLTAWKRHHEFFQLHQWEPSKHRQRKAQSNPHLKSDSMIAVRRPMTWMEKAQRDN